MNNLALKKGKLQRKVSRINSLPARFMIIQTALVLLATFTIGVISIVSSTVAIENTIQADFQHETEIQAGLIQSWIEERKDDMLTIANNADIRKMEYMGVKAAMDQFAMQWPDYQNIFLITPDGERFYDTIGADTNLADRVYFQEGLKGKLNMSEVIVARTTGKPIVVFAAPIYAPDSDQVIAVVGGATQTTFITDLMASNWIGKSGEAYLVNKDGIFITNSRYNEQLIQEGLVETSAMLELQNDSFAVQELLAGKDGVGKYTGYRNKEVIGAYRYIPEQQWGLVIEQETEEALIRINRLRNTMIWLVIGLIAITWSVSFFFAFNLLTSLNGMTEGLVNFSEGILSSEISATNQLTASRRKDELGLAAQGLNAAEAYLLEIAAVMERISSGDLSMEFSARSERDEIGLSVAKMLSSLRELIQNVYTSVKSVQDSSSELITAANQAGLATNQIATTIQQVTRGINQQAGSISSTAATAGQMVQIIENVARGSQDQAWAIESASKAANDIEKTIREASQTAGNGARVVEETIQGMENIKQKVNLSSQRVNEMGQSSSQIGAIVETIEDIASQTNLLALNAAIEAARAGEHGKGFAVVADEVRKLAERSSSATKEIGSLVRHIQGTVNEAVIAMKESAQEVDKGSGRAGKAMQALSSILDSYRQIGQAASDLSSSMESVSAVVEENSASTEEMTASASEVSASVENIASISEENSASIEEVSASTEEVSAQSDMVLDAAQALSEMAGMLQDSVERFKL